MSDQAPAAVDVAAIRARCETATPGPWKWNDINNPRPGVYGTVKDASGQHLMGVIDVENAEFIAHARTDVPTLLSALEAAVFLLAECDALMEFADNIGDEFKTEVRTFVREQR